jgi:CRP-like cAMP-binding protein
MKTVTPAFKNRILKGLPPREGRILVPQLQEVWLTRDEVLSRPGERSRQVFFPDEGLISCISETTNGQSIEVCHVGNEGVVDLGGLLSQYTAFCAVVQIPGRAYRISSAVLKKEFDRCELVHQILMEYTAALVVQLAQTAVCNQFHSVKERFCRWLLMAQDRVKTNEITMTQDGMARTLGSRRASISGVAGALKRKGAIRYDRGIITILDRTALQSECCECYQTIATACQQ